MLYKPLRHSVWMLSLLIAFSALFVPAASLSVQAEIADTPVPIVTDNSVEEWTVGAGLLYWAHNCFGDEFNPFAGLKRKPATGGAERILSSIDDGDQCLTFRFPLSTGDGLYYFNESQKQFERMSLAEPFVPQPLKTLENNQFPTVPFVEAGDHLYWISGFANRIYRTLKDGSGDVETVANTAASPADLILVGNTVYWIDSTGVRSIRTNCDTLPCTSTSNQYALFTGSLRGAGLVYQYLGGFQRNYRLYWVERVPSGSDTNYSIRYASCSEMSTCFLFPPEGQLPPPSPLLYQASTNWFIGKPFLSSNTLFWTEFDTKNPQNGDVKRKVYNAAGTSADTIATGQPNLDSRVYVANTTLFFARRNNGVYTLPLDATAILRDFVADGIEVTQGIQNLANGAPLIADKTTYARVYGRQISGPNTANVEVRLYGTRNNVALPGSPLQPVNGVRALATGGTFDRARLNDGWYFLLPPSWIAVGSTNLRVEIDPRQNHTDPNRDNNQLSQILAFQSQPPVCVVTVPVRTHNPLPSVYDPNVSTMFSQFERRWPIPDLWVFRDTDPVEELEVCWWGPVPYPCHGPYELTDGWGIGGIPDADKVIVSLWGRALLSFNPDVCDDIGAPVHHMGLVHPNANTGNMLGYASTVSKQAWVKLPPHTPNPLANTWDAMGEGSVMAQELAHNYGRKHVDCGSPDDIDTSYPYPPCQIANVGANSYYGFDTVTRQPIRPDQTADFMSYRNRTWVSDYTWRGLFNNFIAASSAASAGQSSAGEDVTADGESVFVAGLVDMDTPRGEVALAMILPTQTLPPATRLAANAQNPSPRHGEEPHITYTLRLLDAADNVLLVRTLILQEMDDHRPDSNTALFSDIFVPPTGQVTKVELVAGNTVVDTLTPGVNKPVAAVQQPAAGAQISDTLTIEWTAFDPDPDDRLLYTVQYSHDDGASWHTLALNVPSTPIPVNSFTLTDLGILHGSAPNAARVRVLATDGYNTAVATSAGFTLANRPPDAAILAPAPGQAFAAGDAVLLQGTAVDIEDGSLPAASLSWQVDGNNIGQGNDLFAPGLAPGTHSAAFSATDSNNQTASQSVSFDVAPLSIPLGVAPILDGGCEDNAYAAAVSLALRPYSDGEQANVRLLRSADYLWACFTGLRLDTQDIGAFAGLRVDVDNSRDPLAQTSDLGFFVGADGDVFTRVGNAAGDFVAPGPAGLQGQIVSTASGWSAELRIDRAVLGGWDRSVNLAVSHHSAAVAADDYAWPYAAAWGQPITWAKTALGSQPFITVLDPFTATATGPSFTMTVTGTNFVSGTVVLWNGDPLVTTFVNGEQLSVDVPAARINSAVVLSITARGPELAGFVSNAVPFAVAGLTPVITALESSSVMAGSEAFTLEVTGSHFEPGALVAWNGGFLIPDSLSSTRLTVFVERGLLFTGGDVGIAVLNPAPTGRTSSPVTFEVTPPAAVIYLPGVEK
ncbi:hypothetical protein GC175_08885 [bacterium]|nr:hypothetical protein [bacterium]